MLSLLPVLSSPFQARLTGPYSIAKCYPNNNYLLNTPDRRRKVQVCHVTPVPSLSVDVVTTTEPLDPNVSTASVDVADHLEIKGPSRGEVEGGTILRF